MVSILMDSTFADSLWCKNLRKSLIEHLRKKRISFCEVFDDFPLDSEAFFVIASDYEWTKNAVVKLNRADIQPILLCNQSEHIPGCAYSCVCSDINTSMKNLLESLKQNGKRNIAIYGVNTKSIADISRMDGLLLWKEDFADSMQIFTNSGSLKNCFNDFKASAERFDAVICVNDFAAISLVRNLSRHCPDILSKLDIISCVKSELSEYYGDHITSLEMNFEKYGEAAVYILECMKKNPYISGITISLKCTIENQAPPKDRKARILNLDKKEDVFYSDKELKGMLIADKFLNVCDRTDRRIIEAMLNGKTYEEIASSDFLTEGGVKYRLKRLQQFCGAEDKDELLRSIKCYIGGAFRQTDCDKS